MVQVRTESIHVCFYKAEKSIQLLFLNIKQLQRGGFMSYFVFRVKNESELKSRVLYAVLTQNSSYSVKEYKEVPDPADCNYHIISLTAYEKGPYRHIRKILAEFNKNHEIECLNGPSSDLL
jgi:hypothetical protein